MFHQSPAQFGDIARARVVNRRRTEAFRGSLGRLGQPMPQVSGFQFRNTNSASAVNCCVGCTRAPATGGHTNLGVGQRGAGAVNLVAANAMEIVFTIAGHRAGIEYDILRTLRTSQWQRRGGAWTRMEAFPMGTNDDHHADDECLSPRSNRIFVLDTPGWPNIALPAPNGTIFGGVTGVPSAADATEIVVRDSFAEWVNARSVDDGISWTALELPPLSGGTPRRHVYWHNIIWLIRNPAGDPTGTWVMGPRSEIRLTALSAAVINAAPA